MGLDPAGDPGRARIHPGQRPRPAPVAWPGLAAPAGSGCAGRSSAGWPVPGGPARPGGRAGRRRPARGAGPARGASRRLRAAATYWERARRLSADPEEPLMTQQPAADIGVTGLAVMGRNLARNLARHGHAVALHNRSAERTRTLVREHGDEGTFVPSETMAGFVASLRRPRVVIIMVKAGAGTDAVINELVPLLEEGDIVVDCGNSQYTDTRRREAALRDHGLHFVGCGVSGG